MNIGITTAIEWSKINWAKETKTVAKLQQKIYRYSIDSKKTSVIATQKVLVQSLSAKLLAVRRVTQDNRGKSTAGVDGIKSLNSSERTKLARTLKLDGQASPIRRVWIPKPGTSELRPLGIPTIKHRAKQQLARLALEPEWEAQFEPNSYGFRPGRSCHDAIEAIDLNINRAPKGKYVLDADIRKCFDTIDHDALLTKLQTWPKIRRQIAAWLKAGVMEGSTVTFTDGAGTPQGGVISPLLANVALHGMEQMLKTWIKTLNLKSASGTRISPANRPNTLGIIRYADDFVVLHKDLAVVNQAREQVQQWLEPMGLGLKDSKTRLVHTDKAISGAPAGFDFLGFSIRPYEGGKYSRGKRGLGSKTLIKPSKSAITKHLNHIKSKLRQIKNPENVVNTLNPIIRGWCNYYKTVVSKRIFNNCRQAVYEKLIAWATRKHANRSRQWVYTKYYVWIGQRLKFSPNTTGDKVLMCHDETKIVRHVKVKGTASVYDGNDLYWSYRLAKFNGLKKRETQLLQHQQGLCNWCGLRLKAYHMLEVDHITPKAKGGTDSWTNLQLLHSYCHDAKHA